jgi:hypothetical protein
MQSMSSDRVKKRFALVLGLPARAHVAQQQRQPDREQDDAERPAPAAA